MTVVEHQTTLGFLRRPHPDLGSAIAVPATAAQPGPTIEACADLAWQPFVADRAARTPRIAALVMGWHCLGRLVFVRGRRFKTPSPCGHCGTRHLSFGSGR